MSKYLTLNFQGQEWANYLVREFKDSVALYQSQPLYMILRQFITILIMTSIFLRSNLMSALHLILVLLSGCFFTQIHKNNCHIQCSYS